MANTAKIRAKLEDGNTVVKILFKHPMETGTRKDKDSGEVIAANFIQHVQAMHGEEMVFSADWGTGIAKNPYLSFKFPGGASGDKITLNWTDNKGDSYSESAEIK